MSPTPAMTGLSEREAADRLQKDGFNELPSGRPRHALAIALEVVREPMFLLLIAAGAVYVLLGDLEEALALSAAVFLVIGITLYQEHKTERALDALRNLASPRALVIRDGAERRIAGREVVRDDIVVLREGDRVAADATVLSGTGLLADESLLTGESVPVRKRPPAGERVRGAPGGDDQPFVYSGTLIVGGDGLARVDATGAATELGKIGTALGRLEIGRTALQREVNRVVRVLAVLGLGACVSVAVAYGATQGNWLDGALAGVTLAISMVPEEFPVVLTVFLALGAWRLSRSRVLTRRIPLIETLGSATVLCVDKTGTLTLNQMQVADVVPYADGDAIADVIAAAALASRARAFDPMERAIHARAQELDAAVPSTLSLVREYPLSDARLAVTQVWRQEGVDGYRVASKGAPEAIATLCRLPDAARGRMLDEVTRLASGGLRVIAVARGGVPDGPLPSSPEDLPLEFLGLVGLADPVRPGVPDAIAECREARIRVVMVTGDYPATASNIARQVGLARADRCLTGADLRAMSDDELGRRVSDVDVFARIVPAQKLRLVTALMARGDVVAMTGDGVNDAPALMAADIGVAMGARGTDVAREAAGLVLLDDDFSSIVRAVRAGRRIYANIEKAMAYVFAVHVPIAGLALVPVLAGWPLILLPVHVVFLELIVDPASSIAFEAEAEERDIMRRPPRDPKRRLFTARFVIRAIVQGLGACVPALAVLALGARAHLSELDLRLLAFSMLIVSNLALIAVNRSLTRPIWSLGLATNRVFPWLVAGTLAALAAVVSVPALRQIFRVAAPHPTDVALIAAGGAAALAWMEIARRLIPAAQR